MSKGLCEENTFDILHKYSEKELADIIYEFGEESFSRKIAKAIKINLNNLKSTEDQAQSFPTARATVLNLGIPGILFIKNATFTQITICYHI